MRTIPWIIKFVSNANPDSGWTKILSTQELVELKQKMVDVSLLKI